MYLWQQNVIAMADLSNDLQKGSSPGARTKRWSRQISMTTALSGKTQKGPCGDTGARGGGQSEVSQRWVDDHHE